MQARWAVPPEHPALAGHFPGHPIVPGALLLDAAIARLEATPAGSTRQARPVRPVRQVREAKFTHRVQPGQALRLHVHDDGNGACRIVIAVQTAPGDWRAAASARLDLDRP